MDNWLCTNRINTGKTPLVVRCARAYEALEYACVRLEGAPSDCKAVIASADARPDVEIRWVGSDFNHGGSPEGNRREVRVRVGDSWSDWERV